MKKGLIFLLCAFLLAVLVILGVGFLTWQSITEKNLPQPQMRVMGQDVTYASYEWHVPVFGGALYKNFAAIAGGALIGSETAADGEAAPAAPANNLGTVEASGEDGAEMTIVPPGGYQTTATLWQGDSRQEFAATADGSLALTVYAQGAYSIHIETVCPRQQGAGYGSFTYSANLTVVPPAAPEPPARPTEPTLLTGNTTLQQGDVLSLQLLALAPGAVPVVKTDLGMAVCTPLGNVPGDWFCAVPIGNTRAAGQYEVSIAAGENQVWTVLVLVEAFDFVEQDLTIDVTDPVIGEANSPAAYQQYREKIPPLFATFDEERYWEGTFIQPAQGRISTEFGTIRYTNGDYENPGIHWGMDIANAEGTPVVAPGAGRVVLAETLLNTGNTLVIEHGGGLKSYYFHMVQLDVAPGDMVAQGQQVGSIGTTGYSTGPHLHFEMRIGNQAINPQLLFAPEAGLYSAGTAQARSNYGTLE